ncbi:Mu transposase C-terminal domain-containing protein [Devosia nitrariae]|uniref:Mu transposase C-terminal domain-containing protein n=1 Tax=Devosia nitrariae TaxID=2071872 RepID=UPI0024E08663|nr:Mu transposase C-terminal domain-containing protein [Devosia nitrariae]
MILTRDNLDQGEESGDIRVERENNYGQHILPQPVRLDLRIKEIWFSLIKEAHEANLFSGCGDAALTPFIEENKPKVEGLILDWLRDPNASPAERKRKAQVGAKKQNALTIDVTIAPRTIRRHFDSWKSTNDILVARKRVENCTKGGKRVSAHVRSEIRRLVKEHSAANRPTINGAHLLIKAAIEEHNKGLPEEVRENVPDRRTVSRHVAKLPEAMKYGGRYGAISEFYNFGPFGEGHLFTRVGELVEADFWNIPLYLLLKRADVLAEVPPELIDQLLSTRIYVFALVDKATGYIPSLAFSTTENSYTARVGLRRAVSDKARLATWAGCSSEWLHFGFDNIVTDAGPAFQADDFHTTAGALGSHFFAASGLPHLRGLIESVFSTLHKGFISSFIARAFSNVVDAGDHEGQKRAHMELEAFLMLMVRYVVDVYNNRTRNDGLRRSPLREVQALAGNMDAKPPPSQDQLTVFFGAQYSRPMTAEGITFEHIRYDNEWLVHHRRHVGLINVNIRVDPDELGWISVEIDGEWLTVAALDTEFRGMPLPEWLEFKKHLRTTFAAEDAIDFREHVGPALVDITNEVRRSERAMGLDREIWTEERLAAHSEQCRIRMVNNAPPLTPVAPSYGNRRIGVDFPGPSTETSGVQISGNQPTPEPPSPSTRRPLKLRRDEK